MNQGQEQYQERAIEILQSVKYATLATVTPEGKPWNSPVAHELDTDLNIYWLSDKEGQHSKNVTNNGRAFIVIYDSNDPRAEGVYIEANVKQVTDPVEILKVRQLTKGSHFEQSPDSFLGDSIRYMYKAIPENVWMNDAEMKNGIFIRDYRVKLSLDQLKKDLKS